MIHVKFPNALPFILNPKIREGTVEDIGGGSYIFRTTSGFKQTLKQGEYEKLMEASTQKSGQSSSDKSEESEEDNVDREKELKKMSMKALRELANSLYEGLDQKAKRSELVELVLKAESEDNKEE